MRGRATHVHKTLADAGLFIALFLPDDALHRRAVEFMRGYRGKLYTTWPVLTEVMAVLPARRQDRFLQWLEDCRATGSLEIECTDPADLGRVRELVARYRDLPMDFADASIWLLALRTGINRVASSDRRDFSVYRLPGKRRFVNLLA